ncbi:hypothetical protein [Dactylosporangium sp. NPDC051541]|uniref:hypothetical protein n=1 Tax=Dactylosporangium sp. NPDC051541 TaxID=3363977 RepID=UPI0037B50AEB
MTALHDRADGDVHVEELLDGARQRGQRRRTVRRTLVGAGAGALALAVVGAVAVLPLRGGDKGGPAQVGEPPPSTAPAAWPGGLRPPVATGAPVLGQGGQPGHGGFHLDVTGTEPSGILWRSGDDWELLDVSTPADGAYWASIGVSEASLDKAHDADGSELHGNPSTRPVTVGGKPAKFVTSGLHPEDGARWGYLRWQPVPGTWAQILRGFPDNPGTNVDTDQAKILEMATWLRFDRVYRCVVNFTVTWTPPATAVTACGFSGGANPAARTYFKAGDSEFSILVQSAALTAVKPIQPNVEYGGVAMEYREGRVSRLAGDLLITLDPHTAALLGQQDALRLVAGVQPVPNSDPAAWPADPTP